MNNESGMWVTAEAFAKVERERDEAVLANGNAEVRCTEALEMAEKLGERLEQAVALLREVEWSSRQVFCPVCGSSRDFGHSSACRLGALLAGQPTPTTPTTPTPGHTIPANAQKRYLRPTHGGSQWEEADDVGGPWSPVPVADARQASWEKHGGVGQVPPDSELASQGLPPVPT